jgi:hypothetical protein
MKGLLDPDTARCAAGCPLQMQYGPIHPALPFAPSGVMWLTQPVGQVAT